jgi:hypothetical protein
MLDFCWISRPFEHTFACGRLPKTPVDQVCHFVVLREQCANRSPEAGFTPSMPLSL